MLFRAGKAHDGYFDNSNIWEQSQRAMDILSKYYPDKDHTFIFDNTKTHLKQPETSLSALKMPENPSQWFSVDIANIRPDGKPKHGVDGKVLKKRIPMAQGQFANGTEQQLYYPVDALHKHAGWFKEMAVILKERGFTHAQGLKTQCGVNFSNCPKGQTSCCCCWLLFNEPDFKQVDSILEIEVKGHGFQVIFLLKFHCELNPIEQCWGFAKRIYRLSKPSSSDQDLERNTAAALEAVLIISMRQFAPCSLSFMDAY